MDKKFRFPFYTQPADDSDAPPLSNETTEEDETSNAPQPTPVRTPTKRVNTPSWFSNLLRQPFLPFLALLVVSFLLGNQVGCEFQKRRGISKQIKAIEKRHQETLNLMDSLYLASAKKEQAALEQVQGLYETLNKLDIKSNVVKTELTKAKQTIEVRKQQISEAIKENNTKVEERQKESEKRKNYFGIEDDDGD